VAVRAIWALLATGEAPQPASVVASDWLAKQRIYCEGRTVCFSGQVVHVASGRGRTVVTDMVPIVGTSAAAFDPQASLMQSGVSLQIAPQLVPGAESAIVDVHSYASELAEPGAIGVSAAVATQPAGGAQASSAVDRVNALSQQMKTTLRVPLGKLVVVGGMTLDPASAEQHERQLCLLMEVTEVK
jgi:hypothetical protein